jgi:hypothetical protein
MTSKNFYKIHRILMPDGTAFELKDAKKAEPTPAGGVTNTGSLAAPISSASGDMVTQPSVDVNPRQSIKTDAKPIIRLQKLIDSVDGDLIEFYEEDIKEIIEIEGS